MSDTAKDANVEQKETKEELQESSKDEVPASQTREQESNETSVPVDTPAPVQPAPKGCRKPDYEQDVIYLYQFSRTPKIPSISPFCLKVETWLRLTGLKYENVDHKMRFKSKKGQLPFIEVNGNEIADSTFIIKELCEKYEKNLDANLDNNQKNVSHATITMIENHLMWVVNWWRSKNPETIIKGYQLNLQQFLGSRIPNALLNFVFKYKYSRNGLKKVKAHGLGVHSPEEIDEFGKNDLKVLSDMLGDKPYFFGDEPTKLDVVVFANLAQIYFVDKEVAFPLRDYMTEHFSNLVGHVNRMKERCFPDWDDICKVLEVTPTKPLTEEKEEKSKDEEKKAEKEGEKIIDDIEKKIDEKIEIGKDVEKQVEENGTPQMVEVKEGN